MTFTILTQIVLVVAMLLAVVIGLDCAGHAIRDRSLGYLAHLVMLLGSSMVFLGCLFGFAALQLLKTMANGITERAGD